MPLAVAADAHIMHADLEFARHVALIDKVKAVRTGPDRDLGQGGHAVIGMEGVEQAVIFYILDIGAVAAAKAALVEGRTVRNKLCRPVFADGSSCISPRAWVEET